MSLPQALRSELKTLFTSGHRTPELEERPPTPLPDKVVAVEGLGEDGPLSPPLPHEEPMETDEPEPPTVALPKVSVKSLGQHLFLFFYLIVNQRDELRAQFYCGYLLRDFFLSLQQIFFYPCNFFFRGFFYPCNNFFLSLQLFFQGIFFYPCNKFFLSLQLFFQGIFSSLQQISPVAGDFFFIPATNIPCCRGFFFIPATNIPCCRGFFFIPATN